MATVREHLSEVHATMAKQHGAEAASHARLAKCYASMGKAAGDVGQMFQDVSDEHSKMCKAHEDAAAYHTECADTCAKAHEVQMTKLVPSEISGIARTDAPPEAFGINAQPRAVPRHGQPIDREDVTKSVPAQFRHLVSGGDEN